MAAVTASPHVAPAGTASAPPATDERAASRTAIPAARLMAAIDVTGVTAPLMLVLARRHAEAWPPGLGELLSMRITLQDIGVVSLFAALSCMVFHAAGLYEAVRVRRRIEEGARICAGVTAVVAFAALAGSSVYPPVFDRAALLLLWTTSLGLVTAARLVRARIASRAAHCRRAIVVGSGPHALRICRELSADPLRSYRVLGFIDTNTSPRSRFVARRTLGDLGQLEALLVQEHVDEVHIGLPIKSHYLQIQETIRVCERIGVKLAYGADLFETELARARVGAATPSPRVELQLVEDGFPVVIKRLMDIVGALIAIVLLSPIMLAAAAAVRLTSEGPVLFAQERYGLNRSRFRMLKFRTMVQNAEKLQAELEAKNEVPGPVFKIARDPRLTPVGRWLRRTSIDELPQLFNVLRGEMSLVGPRPLPLRDVRLFTRSSDMRRFSVRPGITGLWQVSGRSMVDFERWIALDLHYIDNWSLGLDIAIFARTIPAVLRGTGAV